MLELSNECPLPEPTPGITWRYLTAKDAAALNLLIQRIETTDNPPYRSTWLEVTRFFSPDSLWAAIGAFDKQGIMRSFGHLRLRNNVEIVCHGGVDPDWRKRGLGHASLRWQTETSEYVLSNVGEAGSIHIYVEDGRDEWIKHLVGAGYSKQASFVELVLIFDSMTTTVVQQCANEGAFLGHAYDGSPSSPFVAIVPWADEMSEQVRLATGRLSGGTADISEAAWREGWEHFSPEASFIVLDKRTDRSRVVGYVLCSTYPQDFAVLGRQQGTIDMLAIDSEFYDYAPDLIDAVITAYQEQGFEALGASAESTNDSGELSLYRECGFVESSKNHLYTKQSPATANSRPSNNA